jgi:tRNA A-37 threonylcarbamoyl transferase component Bud32
MEERFVSGHYTLHSLLGSGGMADVFLAHDEVLGRNVALKILKKQYAADEGFVELFRREARCAASLNHPNIVTIYDWGCSENETYYIAMEHVPGCTLKDRIRTEGFLDPYVALEVAAWVAQALGFAHEREMIHRDVKSQNILLTEAGIVKVADFGIARAADATTTSGSNPILGTAGYMSPEQIQGGPVGPWSDLYSLGVVLYEMLTGMLPYEVHDQLALTMKHVCEPPRLPSEANPKVPPVLDTLTLRLLAKDPSERYGSVTELLEDLRRVRGELTQAAAHGESLTVGRDVLPTLPVLVNSGGSGRHGGQYVVYGGRFNKIPLALAAASVALLLLLRVAVWGPWWGPQELARAQDVSMGSLDGLGETSDVDEGAEGTNEDERVNDSKESPETGNLSKGEDQGNSEVSTGSPKVSDPDPVFGAAVLQGGAIGQDLEPNSETNAMPGFGPDKISDLEFSDGSMGKDSREPFDAEHVEESAVNGRSPEPTGTGVGPHPTMVPSIERGNSVTNEGGSGSTSKDDGEGKEVEAITDPELPPNIRLEKAKSMAQDLAKGDPSTVSTVKQVIKGKLQEIHHTLAKAASGAGSVYTN